MIRVTVELVPHGTGEPVRLGSAVIANDGTGGMKVGNYEFALAGKKLNRWWRRGRVEKFPRLRLGPWDLLYRVLREAVGDRNNPRRGGSVSSVSTRACGARSVGSSPTRPSITE